MKILKNIITILGLLIFSSGISYAIENVTITHAARTHSVMTTGCTQDVGAAYLNINNIRCRIMDEGDMWWDPGANCNRYYAPANGEVSAQFAGALWIGGVDAGGQLKIAAMTYRQNGEDFWTGPIDTCTGGIVQSECAAWDKMFYVTRAKVEAFHTNYPYGTTNANIPTDILNWPGSGNPAFCESQHLAPYVDVDQNGVYDPQGGDYPDFDLSGTEGCQNVMYGDAALWWVINDVGNTHTETGGVPIGLEIRSQAFAFTTNDAINNMTFYHYQVVNRSTYSLNKTYFGFFDDFDLGNGADNLTGCDVGRNMGYGYDGQPDDPPGTGAFACELGYGTDPAAVGMVFFQGPEADKGDTDCYVKGGYIGMARFVYYNNDFSVQGNPQNQTAYYNYLKGLWTDGTPMTYGGNGYGGTIPCNYMFPWTPAGALGNPNNTNTDPTGCGTGGVPQGNWNEVEAGDPPYDRRFIESAGPFTLQPGAVNYIILGCVWDQPSQSGLGNLYPIGMIQQDADLAQALFNNCFKVVNGPDAPDASIQELANELIITLSNSSTSNNYREKYEEKSPTIISPYTDTDYVFQGYEVFQLLDSSITSSQLTDNTKARLVAECDVQDSISGSIYNFIFNSAANAAAPTFEVNCNNAGIAHSFDIKTDYFQEDNITTLVNDRPYYYMVIAFGYNNYATYNPNNPNDLGGQKLPFLQGRRNIKVYTAYPHIPAAQNYGTQVNSSYGEGLPITRLEGHGNGNNTIELDQNSINYILANDTMAHPSYLPGAGPIKVKVVDPLNVTNASFILKFIKGASATGMDTSATWVLINQNTGEVDSSTRDIGYQYEQVFPQYGISITIADVPYPNYSFNGAIDSTSTMTFANQEQDWLTGVPTAAPAINPLFWIRSGSYLDPVMGGDPDQAFSSYPGTGSTIRYYDPNQYYNKFLDGIWSPYLLCSVSSPKLYCDNGPSDGPVGAIGDSIGNIASVDIVFTADQSKWTRCVVFEEEDSKVLAQGGAAKMDLRDDYSVDKNGNFASSASVAEYDDPTQPNFVSPKGMGWFPGYTINLETGERLNMAFGEDSWLNGDNGRDMKWNPDSNVVQLCGTGTSGACEYFGITSVFGGKHYIYVFGHNNNKVTGTENFSIPAYDNDSTIYADMTTTASLTHTIWKKDVLDDVMWVGIPLLRTGHQLLECDATVRLRVAKPYDTAYGETYLNKGNSGIHLGSTWRNPNPQNNNFPMYSFNTNGLGVVTNDAAEAKNALSLINVVPNPYYAYSEYESDRLDTRVRITNLPPVCTISIFTLSGTLITVLNKNSPETYLDWNLQNQYSVPIAGGLYLIHVAVPGVGEVTLKWFGVMRPIDLNSY